MNENTVDIVDNPIGEYNKNDGCLDGVSDGDEVEKIEQGVYDAPQATQCKRAANYTQLEDETLIKVWESVSLGAVTGND